MLEHQKIVIDNVSEDKYLFRKELVKSLKWLSPDEITQLLKWVKNKYWHIHKEIIKEVFILAIA